MDDNTLAPALADEPGRAFTRRMLNTIFPGSEEFDAFMVDYYPKIQKLFGIGQNRIEKTNMLLCRIESKEICDLLKKEFPEEYEQSSEKQIEKQVLRKITITKTLSDQKVWQLSFNGKFGELSSKDVKRIEEVLGSLVNDNSIRIVDVDSGCIQLTLISSKDSFQKVKSLFAKKKSLDNLSVQSIREIKQQRTIMQILFRSQLEKVRQEELIVAYFLLDYSQLNKQAIEIKGKLRRMQAERDRLDYRIESGFSLTTGVCDVAVLGLRGTGKTTIINKIIETCRRPKNFQSFIALPNVNTITAGHSESIPCTLKVLRTSETKFYEHNLRFLEWNAKYLLKAPSEILEFRREYGLYKEKMKRESNSIHYLGIRYLLIIVSVESDITEQIEFFNDTYLSFVFDESMTSMLWKVCLFINKCDDLSANIAVKQARKEVKQAKAMELFELLIERITKHYAGNFHVVAGTAQGDGDLSRLISLFEPPTEPTDLEFIAY